MSRMTAYRSFVLMFTFLGLWGCASGHRRPFPAEQPAIRQLESIDARLHSAVEKSPFLTMTIIGRVRHERFEAPVALVRFANGPAGAPRILLTGGVHGNEPAGVETAVRLVEHLAADPDSVPACVVEIIPMVNPWGWSHDIRFNREGLDVGRDFASLESQEAGIIQAHLQGNRYDLIIDLHEDPAACGFYMYQYGRPDKSIVEPIIAAVAAMGYPIEQDVKMVTLRTRNGVIDAPLWGLRYMQLTGQLSLSNYGRLYNSPNVFTIETPTRLDWEDRLRLQQRALDMLFDVWVEKGRL